MRARVKPVPASLPEWMRDAGADDDTPFDAQTRAEVVERLALVPSAWSEVILRAALREEGDPAIRRAIKAALKGS